jgi:hypothetical protein
MPSIQEQKYRRLFLIWEHCDVMSKTHSRLFLKKCLKTVKFYTDYCSGKGVPIRRAKWIWYISCIDKRWKICLKINLLNAWAVCFLKGKPPKCARFFNEFNIFAILCQLHYLLVKHKTVFRSNWVHLRFSIWMSWLGYPNELIDFWRPDDCKNRTCFFDRVWPSSIMHLHMSSSIFLSLYETEEFRHTKFW